MYEHVQQTTGLRPSRHGLIINVEACGQKVVDHVLAGGLAIRQRDDVPGFEYEAPAQFKTDLAVGLITEAYLGTSKKGGLSR